MDQLIIPSTFDAYMSGAQVKQAEADRKRQKRFGELIGQMASAQDREPLLQEAASIDPQGAMKAREFYSQQADRANAAKAEQDKRDAVLSLRKVQAMRSAPDSIKVQFYKQSAPDHYKQVVQMLGRDPTPQEINSFIDQNSAELYARAGEQLPKPDIVSAEKRADIDSRERIAKLNREAIGRADNKPPSGYKYAANGDLTYIPGGPADPKNKNASLRPVPANIAQAYSSNNQEIKKLDAAILAIESNPNAFGVKNYLPDAVVQRMDKEGVDARAKVGDIGSMIIHDRSGAAVSASEFPRLRPFIPQATDSPDVVIKKLKNLRSSMSTMQEEIGSMFTESSGYKSLPQVDQPQQDQSNGIRFLGFE